MVIRQQDFEVIDGRFDRRSGVLSRQDQRDAGAVSQEFEYVGSELELFAGAVRWKRYFAAHLRRR